MKGPFFFLPLLVGLLISGTIKGANGIAYIGDEEQTRKSDRDEKCGDDLTWTLVSGLLTVKGTGSMYDYNYSVFPPWYMQRDSIISAVIEEGVSSIGAFSFYSCSSLTEITLPSGVKSIEENTFYGCSNLTQIKIPMSVTSFGSRAFYGCSSLNQLNIPSGVTSIGPYAFYHAGLSKVLIPSSVNSILEGAFSSCPNLLSFEVEEGSVFFRTMNGVLFDHQYATIIQYPAGITNISYNIPDGVSSIGDDAFSGCENLVSVYIPSTVCSIGNESFSYCTSLASVSIPSSVTSIGTGAFSKCYGLLTVTLPSNLTVINDGLFFFCRSLKSINIPEKVSFIGHASFQGCVSLTHITIPSSVKSLGNGVFYGCYGLTNVTIMNGLESIGSGSFISCTSLTSIFLPETVNSIPSGAFFNCTSLSVLFYQGSNTSLGDVGWIFTQCDKLKSVCVSPYYDSSTFCGLNVTSDDDICKDFRGLFNGCSIPAFYGDHFVEQKRKNATDWESLSNACMEYKCDSKDGFVSWSICNSSDKVSHICVKSQCVEEDKIEDKVYVEIEMDGVKVIDANVTELLETISTLCKVSVDQLKIGYEVDNNGFIIRIIVYVNDDETAKIVANMIESLDKGTTCEAGILCKNKAVHIVLSSHSLSGVAQIDVMITNVILLSLMTMNVFAQSLE